jgi:hypothetical protein
MSFVYTLINEAMSGLIKIGRTTTSVKQRISELNAPAGIPLPFTCYYAARVEDCVKVERKLHEAFGRYNWKSAHGAAYWELDGKTIWDRFERMRDNQDS